MATPSVQWELGTAYWQQLGMFLLQVTLGRAPRNELLVLVRRTLMSCTWLGSEEEEEVHLSRHVHRIVKARENRRQNSHSDTVADQEKRFHHSASRGESSGVGRIRISAETSSLGIRAHVPH